MLKRCFVLINLFILVLGVNQSFAATVLNKKEDAAQFKKDIYSEIGVKDSVTAVSGQVKDNSEMLDRFTATIATKTGNTYKNSWSNYTITFEDAYEKASDYYDFSADGARYDFGVAFNDFSRLAVYYTRLSGNINDVAVKLARNVKNPEITEEVIAGETYKHVTNKVKFPYGYEYYEYYIRNLDGKLMVIEAFHEKETAKALDYIDEFVSLT